jgi:uncharacterized membrane protein YjdF
MNASTPTVRLLPLALFTGSYMVIAVTTAVNYENREFIFYIITMVVLIAAMLMMHRRMPLYAGQLWGLSLWGLVHMTGGLVPVPHDWPIDRGQGVLYSLWLIPDLLKYDQLVHAYGFAVTTWLCWHGLHQQMLARSKEPVIPSIGMLTIAAAGGMGFGALNEVIEFIAVLTIPNTNVGGYINTGWDLVFNLIGCLIAAVMIRRRWLV